MALPQPLTALALPQESLLSHQEGQKKLLFVDSLWPAGSNLTWSRILGPLAYWRQSSSSCFVSWGPCHLHCESPGSAFCPILEPRWLLTLFLGHRRLCSRSHHHSWEQEYDWPHLGLAGWVRQGRPLWYLLQEGVISDEVASRVRVESRSEPTSYFIPSTSLSNLPLELAHKHSPYQQGLSGAGEALWAVVE